MPHPTAGSPPNSSHDPLRPAADSCGWNHSRAGVGRQRCLKRCRQPARLPGAVQRLGNARRRLHCPCCLEEERTGVSGSGGPVVHPGRQPPVSPSTWKPASNHLFRRSQQETPAFSGASITTSANTSAHSKPAALAGLAEIARGGGPEPWPASGHDHSGLPSIAPCPARPPPWARKLYRRLPQSDLREPRRAPAAQFTLLGDDLVLGTYLAQQCQWRRFADLCPHQARAPLSAGAAERTAVSWSAHITGWSFDGCGLLQTAIPQARLGRRHDRHAAQPATPTPPSRPGDAFRFCGDPAEGRPPVRPAAAAGWKEEPEALEACRTPSAISPTTP